MVLLTLLKAPPFQFCLFLCVRATREIIILSAR